MADGIRILSLTLNRELFLKEQIRNELASDALIGYFPPLRTLVQHSLAIKEDQRNARQQKEDQRTERKSYKS